MNSGMRHRSDCRGTLQVTVVTVTECRAVLEGYRINTESAD